MLLRSLRLLLALVLFAAVILNAANITARFVFASSFLWAEEILIVLNVAVVFIGLVVCTLEDTHIRIDVLRPLLPERLRPWLDRVSSLGVTLACCGVLLGSWTVLRTVYRSGQKSIAAGYPMLVPHGLIALCLALAAVIALGRVLGMRQAASADRDGERESAR